MRSLILAASRNNKLRDVVAQAPVTRDVVTRFVAGETVAAAIATTRELADQGLLSTVDRLGEDVLNDEDAAKTVSDYLELLDAVADNGLASHVEVSVKLSAVGQALPNNGYDIALANARTICERAAAVGTTVTLDMEDHTTTNATLDIARHLRAEFPWLGVVLQAYLRRTEADIAAVSSEGSRVRLCKGAYNEPVDVAFSSRAEVDRNYVRCLRALLESPAKALIATHDPRMIDIASSLIARQRRTADTYEFQMLHGVRPAEQRRLVEDGHRVRVYVPYGSDWYGYMMRRMAEKPANLALFLRSLTSKS
ncbi:MAG: hypothetical protein RL745_636 [Actinomycetota bacterium]